MTNVAVPLIPRAVLFGHPERMSPEISPDGSRLGYIAPDGGVLNVWVGPFDGSAPPAAVTHDRGGGIRAFGFCHDDRTLVYLQDAAGDENWRVYLLDLETGQSRCVTPYDGVQARILGHNRWNPKTLLLGLNKDDPKLHDVYRLDLGATEPELIERNQGFASWIVDADLVVRGATEMREGGSAMIHLRAAGSAEFTPWRAIPPGDVAGTDVLGLTRDGQTMLLRSSVGANAARLLAVDVSSGQSRVLAEDPCYDVGRVELHPETLQPQAVVFGKDRDEWMYLDRAFGEEMSKIGESFDVDGEIGVGRAERADRTWLLSVMPSDGPVRYYVHDRSSGRTRFLFSQQPELERYRLTPMEPFTVTTSDGLDVHGYVTFPAGVPRRGLPAVLNVHGGPRARDAWGYDAEAQWLANRGYVCIQVNFRGSAGYGKAFCSAGDKEWGRLMQQDLLDAAQFCVEQGWVDPARIGIMGASYGGYAALAAAAFTPDVFRCAIDLCGPSNLLTLLESIPPYWRPMARYMHAMIGDPATERDMLWERSPLSRVDAISIPVLVAHGRNDPRVKQAEAEQIVAALTAKAVPHEYLLFDDEGHGLTRPENRELFYATAERFLAEHLGGRHE